MQLANSYKRTPGRCVAGRQFSDGNAAGGWIRPISDLPQGELLPQHMVTATRFPLVVLDVVDVPLHRHAQDKSHPEDWLIDAAQPWQQRGKFTRKDLPALAEEPADLWMDPAMRGDRVTTGFLHKRPNHQSLYLIRPANFRVELTYDYHPVAQYNQRKRRACFTYRGQEYALPLTDPEFINRYASKFPGPDRPAIVVRPPYRDRCLLCVSITPVYLGYHYKLVATVLEVP